MRASGWLKCFADCTWGVLKVNLWLIGIHKKCCAGAQKSAGITILEFDA
jgi:hypothetical protein